MLQYALELAAMGYPVFQVAPNGKRPNGKTAPHGCSDATRDADVIRQWFKISPDANLGIQCADLLILDEPFTGLDPLARIHFRKLLMKLRDQGKSIFFSSHELGETELLCDNVAIMKKGRCIYHGSVDRLAGDGGGNLERLFLEVLEKGGVA